jgi:hypothetical protein
MQKVHTSSCKIHTLFMYVTYLTGRVRACVCVCVCMAESSVSGAHAELGVHCAFGRDGIIVTLNLFMHRSVDTPSIPAVDL